MDVCERRLLLPREDGELQEAETVGPGRTGDRTVVVSRRPVSV